MFYQCVTCLLALSVVAAPARADTFQGDPASYRSLLDQLQPGDTLELAAGDYVDGLPVVDLVGDAANNIVITGPETGPPAVLHGDPCCNTVRIRRSAYVVIRHLVIDGGLVPDIDAVKLEGDAGNWGHHITVEHCTITGHDPSQQVVGISTKAPAWDWVIRQNIISSAGTGLYLGNSNGEAPFVRGLIEYNLVENPEGYCLQIKHQNPRPALPDMPAGASSTIIRHNVFIKDDDPSGSGDRPSVLLGHFPLSGVGRDDTYELYGNFFFHNPREALLQAEGNVHIHDNLFVDSGPGWPAINVGPHNDVPREVFIYNNTVHAADTGIRLSGADPGFSQIVAGNAIFAADPLSLDAQVQSLDNVTDDPTAAGLYVTDPALALGQLDLYPLPGALTGAVVDSATFAADLDHDLDFNGVTKDFTWRGAYHAGAPTNPGWTLAAEIKGETTTTPPPDAGAGPGPDGGGPGVDAGGDPPADGGGCGCSESGSGDAGGPLAILLWIGFLLRRSRRRAEA